tara:strand:- start:2493 stop:3620 length:1128 start_codon:yes stop_codon:yes gene_type:complete
MARLNFSSLIEKPLSGVQQVSGFLNKNIPFGRNNQAQLEMDRVLTRGANVNGDQLDFATQNEELIEAQQMGPQPQSIGNRVLSGLKEVASKPETYRNLATIGSIVAAAQGEQGLANTLSTVSNQLGQGIIREENKAILAAEKKQEDEIAEEERKQQAIKDNLTNELTRLNIDAKTLDNQSNLELLPGKLKQQNLELKKLELDLEKKLTAPTEKELMRNEAYKKAYSSWLTKVNDPREASFRARMQDSNKVLTDMEEAKRWSLYSKSLNPLKIKQRKQAEVNFLTAVLRKESGASINPDEFVTARKVYFPQIGDSKAVVKQKQLARQRAFELIEPKRIGSESVQETVTDPSINPGRKTQIRKVYNPKTNNFDVVAP